MKITLTPDDENREFALGSRPSTVPPPLPEVPNPEGDPLNTTTQMPPPRITFEPEDVDMMLREESGRATGTVGAIQDLFNGFNQVFSDALGMASGSNPGPQAVNLANSVYGYLTGSGFLDQPIDGREAVKQAMDAMGMTYDDAPVSQLMNDIGRETFQQMILAGTMLASSGAMAGVQGEGVLNNIVREMGQYAQRNPGAMIASEIGAGVGAQVGEELGGTPGEIAGSLLGAGAGATTTLGRAIPGVVGGAIGGTVGGVGGALAPFLGAAGPILGAGTGASLGWRWSRGMQERILRSGIPLEQTPLLTGGRIEDATEFAREVVMAEREGLEGEIAKTFNRLTASGDPQLEAEALRRTVSEAYTKGQARASDLWSRVDTEQVVGPPQQTLSTAAEMIRTNPKTAPEFIPQDIIDRIQGLVPRDRQGPAPLPRYGQEPGSPSAAQKPTTLKDLRGLQSVISARMREDNMPDELRRNLNILFDSIDADIKHALPDDRSLQVAREYTKWLHDHLSRGPLGKFRGAEANAYQRSISGDLEAARNLIRQSESGTMLAQVSQALDMPQLERAAVDFARQNLAEIFADRGPEATARLMSSPSVQRFMEAFPKASAEFTADTTRLSAALADQKALDLSAFKTFAGSDPQAAAASVFQGGQRVARANEIKANLFDNADAIRGFKDGVLTHFYGMGGGSPRKLSQLLAVRDNRDVLASVLSPDEMRRFERMVKAGARLEEKGSLAGNRTMLGTVFRYGGAAAARAMGGKTIQQTATGATIAQAAAERLTSAAPGRDLFAQAIMDPKMERLLYSRVPETLRELQASQELVRNVIGVSRAARSEDDE